MFETRPYLTTSDIRNRLDICVGLNKISKYEADNVVKLLQLDYEENKKHTLRYNGFIDDFKALLKYYNAKIMISDPLVKWELLFDGSSYARSGAMYIDPCEVENLRKRYKRWEYFKKVIPHLSDKLSIDELRPVIEATYNVSGIRKVTEKSFKEKVANLRRLNDELSQQ